MKHLHTPIVSFSPLTLLRAVRSYVRKELAWGKAAHRLVMALRRRAQPVPCVLSCPACSAPHVDRGEWAARPHAEHLCDRCGLLFTPYPFRTVGITANKAAESKG